ncbi:CAP domain-containing protein [Microvirga sp. W0021]|uniref:CAP domain-containing protein n=1 Tax=Hohaiivirga grylli TaxID=3133970 RepID=A0ABV0BGH3_9HYPH
MRAIVISIALFLGLTACSDQPSGRGARIIGVTTSDAATAARIISAYRVSRGLSPVTVNSKLNEAAIAHAKANASVGKLFHGNFSARMHQFSIRGAAAENLSANANTVQDAIERWKKSPGHNSNLLMPEARQIGIAKVTTGSGYRTYWALVLSANQSDPNNGMQW